MLQMLRCVLILFTLFSLIPAHAAELAGADVNAIRIAPDGRIYAGLDSGGIVMSTDNGATWSLANRRLISRPVWTLAFASDGMIYAGTAEGIFHSRDKGANWSRNIVQPLKYVTTVLTLGSVVYIASSVEAGAIFKSTDKGAHWKSLNSSPNRAMNSGVHVLASAKDGALYAGTAAGIFKSNDDGVNWTNVSHELTDLRFLSLSILDDGVIYAGTNFGLFKSTTQGGKWIPVRKGMIELGGDGEWRRRLPAVNAILVDADHTMHVATNGGPLFNSVDGGATWKRAHLGLSPPNVPASAKSLAATKDGALLIGTLDGIFKSTDKGISWTTLLRLIKPQ